MTISLSYPSRMGAPTRRVAGDICARFIDIWMLFYKAHCRSMIKMQENSHRLSRSKLHEHAQQARFSLSQLSSLEGQA